MKIFIVKGYVVVPYEIEFQWNCKAFLNKEKAQKLESQLNSELKRLHKKERETINSWEFSFNDSCKEELKEFFGDGDDLKYLEPFFIEELELEE